MDESIGEKQPNDGGRPVAKLDKYEAGGKTAATTIKGDVEQTPMMKNISTPPPAHNIIYRQYDFEGTQNIKDGDNVQKLKPTMQSGNMYTMVVGLLRVLVVHHMELEKLVSCANSAAMDTLVEIPAMVRMARTTIIIMKTDIKEITTIEISP